ncbi:MAG: glycerol-3-phosphate acyltransferase [Oscillospiraceae bacterium]|nr:glycerol-3-phosphate acyltransferase [Oscillospiraceae bacterium]
MWLAIVVGLLVSYLLGNLNGAVCISALHHDDVRSHGSGNAGLTNFIRNYGRRQALYVILIDAGKTVLACLVMGLLLEPYGYYLEGRTLGGLMVMVGHAFPALLGFRGGKGILSGLFIGISVDWRIAVIALAVFLGIYFATRYVSLGSVLGATTLSLGFVLFYYDNLLVMLCGIVMGALAVFMHRANIIRLLQGKERKTHLFRNIKE